MAGENQKLATWLEMPATHVFISDSFEGMHS
jgi:hypothetical protein